MTTTTETNAPTQPLETTEDDLMAFVHRAVGDVGAVLNGAMVVIGDRLGLYRAMAGQGPITPTELAEATGTDERYVREWLSAQAAAGYVTHEDDGRFRLPDEPAIALTDETSPACVVGAFELAVASLQATDRITDAFRTGDGMPWGDHHHDVHEGCERFFRPGYLNNLVAEWLPALDGVVDALTAGARVADIGCGHGASTLDDGRGVPAVDVRRVRRAPGLDRGGPAAGGRRRPVRPRHVRGGSGQGRDRPVRPGVLLRLPARHGRPGRRAAQRALDPGRRGHDHARRADGRRHDRRQHQPGRRRLLRLLDAAVHAQLAQPGGGGRPRRPGRRGRGCATSPPRPASPRCAGWRRRRSTWSSNCGRDPRPRPGRPHLYDRP